MKEQFNRLFFPHDHKEDHFRSLDGLRGLAVLFVLLSHASNSELFFHEWLNFAKIGKTGVYLFFVLSAYLLDRQIALAYLSGKSSKAYWKNYFLRRFLRIYPLFIVSLLLHGLVNYLGIETVIDKTSDIWQHIIMMKGESIFWSIPVEFKYYFISPLFLWFCHRFLKWNPKKMLLLFLVVLFGSVVLEYIFLFERTSTLRYFPIFLVGTFISIYELLFRKEMKNEKTVLIYRVIGILSFGLILITTPFYFKKIFGFGLNFQSATYYFPFAVLWGLVLLSTKYAKGIIRKFLEIKFLRFIGTISFSLYLFHMIFLKMALYFDMPEGLRIYFFYLTTILFSSISYLLIERPLSKIKIYKGSLTEKSLEEKK